MAISHRSESRAPSGSDAQHGPARRRAIGVAFGLMTIFVAAALHWSSPPKFTTDHARLAVAFSAAPAVTATAVTAAAATAAAVGASALNRPTEGAVSAATTAAASLRISDAAAAVSSTTTTTLPTVNDIPNASVVPTTTISSRAARRRPAPADPTAVPPSPPPSATTSTAAPAPDVPRYFTQNEGTACEFSIDNLANHTAALNATFLDACGGPVFGRAAALPEADATAIDPMLQCNELTRYIYAGAFGHYVGGGYHFQRRKFLERTVPAMDPPLFLWYLTNYGCHTAYRGPRGGALFGNIRGAFTAVTRATNQAIAVATSNLVWKYHLGEMSDTDTAPVKLATTMKALAAQYYAGLGDSPPPTTKAPDQHAAPDSSDSPPPSSATLPAAWAAAAAGPDQRAFAALGAAVAVDANTTVVDEAAEQTQPRRRKVRVRVRVTGGPPSPPPEPDASRTTTDPPPAASSRPRRAGGAVHVALSGHRRVDGDGASPPTEEDAATETPAPPRRRPKPPPPAATRPAADAAAGGGGDSGTTEPNQIQRPAAGTHQGEEDASAESEDARRRRVAEERMKRRQAQREQQHPPGSGGGSRGAARRGMSHGGARVVEPPVLGHGLAVPTLYTKELYGQQFQEFVAYVARAYTSGVLDLPNVTIVAYHAEDPRDHAMRSWLEPLLAPEVTFRWLRAGEVVHIERPWFVAFDSIDVMNPCEAIFATLRLLPRALARVRGDYKFFELGPTGSSHSNETSPTTTTTTADGSLSPDARENALGRGWFVWGNTPLSVRKDATGVNDTEWARRTFPKKIAIIKEDAHARHRRAFKLTPDGREMLEGLGYTIVADNTPFHHRLALIAHAEVLLTTFGALQAMMSIIAPTYGRSKPLRLVVLMHHGYHPERIWAVPYRVRGGVQDGAQVFVGQHLALSPAEAWVKLVVAFGDVLHAPQVTRGHVTFDEADCTLDPTAATDFPSEALPWDPRVGNHRAVDTTNASWLELPQFGQRCPKFIPGDPTERTDPSKK